MHMDGALAAPLPVTYSLRLARQAAVQDPSISPVDGPQAPGPKTALASSTSTQRNLDHAAEQGVEQQRLRARELTAEDFAAVQAQLGIGPTGGLRPAEDGAQLEIQQIPPQPERQPRDFSEAVADAVVTIEEYLEWVNDAGGQAR